MKDFALIGAAGYIAPRHFKAIKETGNNLVAAMDPFDSVGLLDSFFPKADFFSEFERFDRYIDKYNRSGNKLDFLSVCSPNYLHDSHIRFGLKQGADVICEKPLVLNPWNIEGLRAVEKETGNKIYNILQLRLHPAIQQLKKQAESSDKVLDIDLTYITSRGNWYFSSWKGNQDKSGGVATNVGIHFFDMLLWIFGPLEQSIVHLHSHDRAAGVLRLKGANVRWFLSIDEETLPENCKENGIRTFRSLIVDGREFEFSKGFTDLHTESYSAIINGQGYGLDAVEPSISLVESVRTAKLKDLSGEHHPMARLDQTDHPFFPTKRNS